MTRPFILQGHRGARGLFPENTLGGFRAAMALGVTWFETDIAVLKDGTVVLHHDPALNPDLACMGGRYLSGSLPLLRSLAWDDLEDITVGRLRPGSDLAGLYPHQVAMENEPIPTLAAALALDPGIHWMLELKLMPDRPDWTVSAVEMVERVLAVVDEAGAAGRVTLQSFDWRAPRHARALRPSLPVAWLTAAETASEPELWWGRRDGHSTRKSIPQSIAEEGGGTWTPGHEALTRELLEEAQRLGLAVIPWTVNEVTDMKRLIGWGVDGLITDYPDRALPLLPLRP